MWRVVVSEEGGAGGAGGGLPAIDVSDEEFTIGAGEGARVRLPAEGARGETVRVRAADVGDGREWTVGRYRVRVAPAPAGAVATPPQRTESLARELLRGLLGAGAAPSLEVEAGALRGAKRALAPPESVLVIGRGDEAGWIVDDGDLSRAHAEVRRGWDGVRVVDLGSKNGTRVDGAVVAAGGEGVELRDGALVELGALRLRFRDPAERHLRGGEAPVRPVAAARAAIAERAAPRGAGAGAGAAFWVAIAIAVAALAGLAWVLTA